VRASPFAAQCEAGNVKLVAGPWVEAFIDEITTFPNGKHDDQVDAAASAFNVLASNNSAARWIMHMDQVEKLRQEQNQ
jgi:predicted phage terminase large subunit-like protein